MQRISNDVPPSRIGHSPPTEGVTLGAPVGDEHDIDRHRGRQLRRLFCALLTGLGLLGASAGTAHALQALPVTVTGSTNWAVATSLPPAGPPTTFSHGTKPLTPIIGDWDGNGTRTPGTFEGGVFKLSNALPPSGPTITLPFGDPRGFPVAGDFNGDGADDLAVYRNGLWQIRVESGGTGSGGTVSPSNVTAYSGSWPSTIPVAGDWDGNGVDGIGRFTLLTGEWLLRHTTVGPDMPAFTYSTAPGAYPVVGDWDNDLDDSVGVRAGTSWLLNNQNDSSAPDIAFELGLANDLPLVGGGTASATNTAPVVQTTAANLNYPENAGPLAADGGVTVTDPDSPTLQSATVAITSNFVSAQDELGFVNQLGITGNYNDATGVLTLAGPASVANFQTALRAVTYENVSDDPNPPARQLTFIVHDGSLSSTPATRTITLGASNDPAAVSTAAGPLIYTEGDPATVIDTTLAVNDPDDANLTGATVQITAGRQSGDELLFTDSFGVSNGGYDAGTGLLTLTGTASPASYQQALRAVQYRHTGDAPVGSRTVTFRADDGDGLGPGGTRTINITAVNDAPVVTTSAGSAAFTVGGSAVVVDPGLTVDDPDSTQLSGATVSISANATAGDALNFTPAGSITGVGAGTPTLTLSGAGTRAQYQAVLRSVTYQGTTAAPAARTISFRATDSAAANSNIATRGVAVAAAGNSAPVVTATGGSTAYSEGAAPVTVDGGVTVVDADDASLAGAQVRISAGFETGDALTFTPAGGAGGAGSSYDAGTGVLTLTGPGTVSDFQAVLRSVQFSSTSENPAASKTVEFRADDGDVDSDLATKAIAVTRVNDAPVADDETFGNNLGFGSALANTRFVVGTTSTGPRLTVPGDVLDGDTDPDTPAANLTAGPASITSTQCAATCTGNVTMQADGQFIYDPKPGFKGSDTFTYTVNDNSAVAPANQTATGTVTVWVSGPLVWYVDGDAPAPAAGRAGTSHAPSNTLSALNTGGSLDALDGEGDIIFVYSAASSYTGGIVLENVQRLIGESNGLDVFVGASGNPTSIVPAGGSNPVIVNAAGDGVNLAFGNHIQGIDLGNASGAALFGNFISSATMGTQTPGAIDNQTVGGQAVNISLGTLNMNFTSVSSTGGQHAIRLDHTQGNFTANGGTLSNTTDTDVVITGNNSFDDISFTYGGAISDDSGPLIRIANQTGGRKRFTGPITDLPATPDNGGGILLQNNFGGGGTNNIHFDGGLTLSTGTSDAVVDDNGGTLAITDPGGVGVGIDNTLATTTGIALNLDYATIHDDDLTFRSIKSNGAPSAIRLNNVFNVNGRLNVTGDGGACTSAATCSGGTIQNSTGDGISLHGVLSRVSLSRMQVSDSGAHGIHAIAADGVALASSRIVDNGDAADEHGLAYEDVAGDWSIADTLVTGSADDNLRLANTPTSDPLAVSLDITGSTFASNSTTTGGYGAEFLFRSEGSADVNVTDSTFAANRQGGIVIDAASSESATIDAHLKSNAVIGGNAGAVTSEAGITVNASQGDLSIEPIQQTRAEIDDNTISRTRGPALFVIAPPDGTAGSRLDATITNNTIGDGNALSGSELADAVVAQNDGSGRARFAIRNNTIRNYRGRGLFVFATGTATTDATVTQNTISDPSGTDRPGVAVRSGSLAGGTTNLCADIGGAGVENDLGAAGPSGQVDVELMTADLRLPGFTTGADVQTYIAGRNLGSPTVSVPGNAPTGQAGGCALPALPPP